MKKSSLFMAILAFAAIALITLATSCNSQNKTLNPVRDVKPVDTTWWSGTSIIGEDSIIVESGCFPLHHFHALGDRGDTAAQYRLFKEHLRDLTINVKSHYPSIQSHENIRFYLASGFATDVESGDGNSYSGDIKNELLIVISDPTVHKTLFLACGNGMMSETSMGLNCVYWGTAIPWEITIKEGQSLAYYFPNLDVWADLAEKLGIPIVNEKGRLVPYHVYRYEPGNYISLLWPDDKINLLELTAKDVDGYPIDAQMRYFIYKHRFAPNPAARPTNSKTKRR